MSACRHPGSDAIPEPRTTPGGRVQQVCAHQRFVGVVSEFRIGEIVEAADIEAIVKRV